MDAYTAGYLLIPAILIGMFIKWIISKGPHNRE